MKEIKGIKHQTFLYDNSKQLYIDIVTDSHNITAFLFCLNYSGKMLLGIYDPSAVAVADVQKSVVELLENGKMIHEYFKSYYPISWK